MKRDMVTPDNRLRQLRQARGLSLRGLAEKTGVDFSTVGFAERGERNFSMNSACKLADFFGVTLDYLVGRDIKTHKMQDEQKPVGIKIKELREARGLSRRALAAAVGLCHSTIARIENGERKISTPQASKLAEYFDVSLDYLIGASSTTETPKSASQEQIYTKTEPGNHKELFRKTKLGYVQVYLPTSPMAGKDGWVLLHRAVMAEHLGRPLRPEEVVHHIDGDPGNNKLSNLMLFPNNAEHRKYHGQLKRDAEIKRLLNE